MLTRAGTVLFVDDEPSVVEALRLSHGRQSYQVLTATSAEEALAVLAQQHADVVVSDQQMPGMTGVELLARVAQRFPGIVRILLTGHATLPVALQAVNEGRVYRILLKPCSHEVLTHTLTESLAHGRLLAVTNSFLDAARTYAGVPGAPAWLGQEAATETRSGTSLDNEGVTERFSRRELEVLHFLATGQRVAEIAAALFVSEHTVRNHVKAMFRKSGVHSQRELISLFKRPA